MLIFKATIRLFLDRPQKRRISRAGVRPRPGFLVLAAAMTCLACLSPRAGASSFEYRAGAASYQVLPNAAVVIDLYLVETWTTGQTSQINDENGLISADALVERISGLQLAPAAFTDAMANAVDFNDVGGGDIVVNPDSVSLLVVQDPFEPVGVLGQSPDPLERRVLLGSVTVRGGAVIGEVTNFTIGDDPALGDSTLTLDGVGSLDAIIGDGQFSVEVVPTPASWMAGLAGFMAVGARRRRRAAAWTPVRA